LKLLLKLRLLHRMWLWIWNLTQTSTWTLTLTMKLWNLYSDFYLDFKFFTFETLKLRLWLCLLTIENSQFWNYNFHYEIFKLWNIEALTLTSTPASNFTFKLLLWSGLRNLKPLNFLLIKQIFRIGWWMLQFCLWWTDRLYHILGSAAQRACPVKLVYSVISSSHCIKTYSVMEASHFFRQWPW